MEIIAIKEGDKAIHSELTPWVVSFPNGQVIFNVFGKNAEEAIEFAEETPEYRNAQYKRLDPEVETRIREIKKVRNMC